MIAERPHLSEDVLRKILSQNLPASDALRDVVAEIGNYFEVDVCSVYLKESHSEKLVLAATVGLNQDCIGLLKMGLHEGLAGMVAENLRPVSVAEAAKHPRFKYFPEAEEDAYESFLGVPINSLGVLVVQTEEPRCYLPTEIIRLLDLATMLGAYLNKV